MNQIKIQDLWELLYDDISSIITGIALRKGSNLEFKGDSAPNKPDQLRFLLVNEIYDVLCVGKAHEIPANTASQFLSGLIDTTSKKSNTGKYQKILKVIQAESGIISFQIEHLEQAIENSIQFKSYLRESKSIEYSVSIEKLKQIDSTNKRYIDDTRRRFLLKLADSTNDYMGTLDASFISETKLLLPNANKENVLCVCSILLIEAFTELQCTGEFDEKKRKIITDSIKKIRLLIRDYLTDITSDSSLKKEVHPEKVLVSKTQTDEEDKTLLYLLTKKLHESHGGKFEDTEALRILYDRLAEITQVIRAVNMDMWRQYDSKMKAQAIIKAYNMEQALTEDLDLTITNT